MEGNRNLGPNEGRGSGDEGEESSLLGQRGQLAVGGKLREESRLMLRFLSRAVVYKGVAITKVTVQEDRRLLEGEG